MDIVLNNPFRFLGLPVNSPEKSIKKNIQNFEVFLSIGQQPKSQETDFEFLGEIERNSDMLAETVRKIEDPKDKLNYSLFWFSKFTAVDIEVFENLKGNEIDEAIEKWESTIAGNRITKNNFTSYKNLGILYYYMAFDNGSIDIRSLGKAITLFGKSLNSDVFWEHYVSHFNNSILINAANRTESLRYLFRTMIKEIQEKYNIYEDVEFIKKLINHRQIPTELKEEITSGLIYDKITFIESEIESCRNDTNSQKTNSYNHGVNLYNNIEDDIYFVKSILGENDYRFIMLSDKIADEFINCAVLTFNNDIDERFTIQKVETLLSYAEEYAIGDLAKKKLQENEKAFKDAVNSRSNDSVVSNFFEKLDRSNQRLEKNDHPYNIYEDFLIVLKDTLSRIDKSLDTEYLSMIYNLSAALFKNCAVKLSNTYNDFTRAKEILYKSLDYAKDPELKNKINEDLKTVMNNEIMSSFQFLYSGGSGIKKSQGKTSGKTTSVPPKVQYKKDDSSILNNDKIKNTLLFILAVILLGGLISICYLSAKSGNSGKNKTENTNSTKTGTTTTTGKDPVTSTSNGNGTTKVETKEEPRDTEGDLEVTRLKTGTAPYNSYFKSIRSDKSSNCWLRLINDTGEDALISLVKKSNDKVTRCVYVRSNESYTIKNIPPGNYYMKVYMGTGWSNDKTFNNNNIRGGFKYHGEFAKFPTTIEVEQYRTNRGITFSTGDWTLYTMTTTSSYDFNSTSANDFFNDE